MDPRIDAVLREFLGSWKNDQEKGLTVANLLLEIRQLKIEVEEWINENKLLRMRVERHGQRIHALEKHLAIGDSVEDTGQHQVEDLKRLLAERERQLEERKEEGRWWRRTSVKWIVAGVAWIVTTLVTLGTAIALGRGH